MTLKPFIAMAAAGVMLAACAPKQEADKTLVLYYSQTGTTKAVAEMFAEKLSADVCAIELEEPYDGTYDETIARGLKEMETETYPKHKPLGVDLAEYKTVVLGFPIWFGRPALGVESVLQSEDFAGKTVVPFCTFGSGGTEAATMMLRDRLGDKATVLDGYGVRQARLASASVEIDKYIVEVGLLPGEKEQLPDFGYFVEVDPERQAIYDAACGDYPIPLGTPTMVCFREVPGGMEYMFLNKTGDAESNVFVLALDGHEPEFTRVVR